MIWGWVPKCSAAWNHDDVIKWKHSPRYWPFVWGIHRSPVISPHKGQWRGALMFYLICAWINRWVNNGEAGDFRSYRAHCDVIVMAHSKAYWFHQLVISNHCGQTMGRRVRLSGISISQFRLSWKDPSPGKYRDSAYHRLYSTNPANCHGDNKQSLAHQLVIKPRNELLVI